MIYKCKICGGTLEINNETVVTCEYCGTQQTLPRLDNERRANLYDRANHFRRNNEFDKAMGIYEQILNEDSTDAEAYWSLVLCRYGIEYVEDPSSHKRVPTVNRAQFTSIFDDSNYKSALEYADAYQRRIYEAEANTINEIQKGILSISQKEEPFDVFICYKESDANGRRTPDSVLATELYHELTREGFKVFFARITLEDKLGQEYEPYIFAALNSAKVMVVLGTKPEYFSAVWVKNEWSRYLALIKNGARKILIPAYRDMDPYDLPDEFSHLQAQDMSKLGFMQDLIRGIKKIATAEASKPAVVKETVITNGNANVAPLLKRAFMFLEDGDWNSTDEYCEKVLDIDPENAQAYLGKLMAELHIKKPDALKNCEKPFDSHSYYQKVLRFGDGELVSFMKDCISFINERNEKDRLEQEKTRIAREEKAKADALARQIRAKKALKMVGIFLTVALIVTALALAVYYVGIPYYRYTQALKMMDNGQYTEAYAELADLNGFLDSEEQIKSGKYKQALEMIDNENYDSAYDILTQLGDYNYASTVINESKLTRATRLLDDKLYEEAYELLKQVGDYNDALNIINESKYTRGVAHIENGEYDKGYRLLNEVITYKDAEQRIYDSKYSRGIAHIEAGKFDEGYDLLDEIGAIDVINESKYNRGIEYFEHGNYLSGYDMLMSIKSYKDAESQAKELLYQQGMEFYNDKDYETSDPIFGRLDNYKDSKDLIHSHEYTSEVTTKATCEKTGLKTLACDCGYSYTESIKATGHNYSSKVTQKATCENDGVRTYTCNNCRDSYTEIIKAAGHNWVDATCTEAKYCKTCEEKTGRALGHTTSTGVCSRCKYNFWSPVEISDTITSVGYKSSGYKSRYVYGMPDGYYLISVKVTIYRNSSQYEPQFGFSLAGWGDHMDKYSTSTSFERVIYVDYETICIYTSMEGGKTEYEITIEPVNN